jgi:hypothetical protein
VAQHVRMRIGDREPPGLWGDRELDSVPPERRSRRCRPDVPEPAADMAARVRSDEHHLVPCAG